MGDVFLLVGVLAVLIVVLMFLVVLEENRADRKKEAVEKERRDAEDRATRERLPPGEWFNAFGR